MEVLIITPLVIKGVISLAGMGAATFMIWLGFRLYMKGAFETGDAQAGLGSFSIKLKNYGPGLVMMLFGSVIIGLAITRTMSLTYPVGVQYAAPAHAAEDAAEMAKSSADAAAAAAAAAEVYAYASADAAAEAAPSDGE